MDRNSLILGCVAIYMLSCIVIGLWAMTRTKSSHDFFMASRSLGFFVTGVAIFSSIMSGFGFVGGPGLVYAMGSSSLWILVSAPIGLALGFFLLGKRLRLLAELRDSVSLPDLAHARYQSRWVRLLVAVAILFGVITYLSVQIKAMALVLQEIFARNEIWGHESLFLCVCVSSVLLAFYCVTGGIIASVYTDVFQGLVMIAVAVLVFLTALASVEGGLAECVRTIQHDDAEAAGPWGTMGILGCLSWFFVFAFGSLGQPHVITKMMMSRRVEDVRFTAPLTMTGYVLTALLWISIGMVMRTHVLNGQHPDLSRADDAAAEFLYSYASPLLAGLTFAGLFAAIMSTADGFLNVGAAAVVHDIPQAIKGRSLRQELLWARIATGGLTILAAWFALASPDLVGILGTYGWGVFSAALAPCIGIGLNWKRATAFACIVSVLLSMLINAVAFALQLQGIFIPYGVSPGAVALLVSLLSFVLISLLSNPEPLAPDVDAVMDL